MAGITLQEVSRRAGVSTATVSRVLNNSPLVHPDTRRRVLRLIKQLNYHPSPTARALARARTQTLAVLFPGIASGFYSEVLCGMDDVASERGYHLMIAFSHGPQDQEELFIRCLRERRADALVVLNLNPPDALVRAATAHETPVVFIDRPARGRRISCVQIDNETGSVEAVRHLAAHGYRQIAVLSGPTDSFDAQQRLAAYRQAMREHGLPVTSELVWQGAFTEESGYAAVQRWLKRNRSLPDALFACNDAMAFGARQALQERGLNLPMVGFDDCETARHLGLTTVHVPMRQMGRWAVELALAWIEGAPNEGVPDRVVPTRLVVRESCGCARKGVKV